LLFEAAVERSSKSYEQDTIRGSLEEQEEVKESFKCVRLHVVEGDEPSSEQHELKDDHL